MSEHDDFLPVPQFHPENERGTPVPYSFPRRLTIPEYVYLIRFIDGNIEEFRRESYLSGRIPTPLREFRLENLVGPFLSRICPDLDNLTRPWFETDQDKPVEAGYSEQWFFEQVLLVAREGTDGYDIRRALREKLTTPQLLAFNQFLNGKLGAGVVLASNTVADARRIIRLPGWAIVSAVFAVAAAVASGGVTAATLSITGAVCSLVAAKMKVNRLEAEILGVFARHTSGGWDGQIDRARLLELINEERAMIYSDLRAIGKGAPKMPLKKIKLDDALDSLVDKEIISYEQQNLVVWNALPIRI
jgi:hypothetical protein